jgi:hypothetical protein
MDKNEPKGCPWCLIAAESLEADIEALEAENAALKASVLSEDEQEAADYGIALVDKEISVTFEYSQITGSKDGYDEALASLKKMKTLRNLLERAKR